MILALIQEEGISPILQTVLLIIFMLGMVAIVLSRFYVFFEEQYAMRMKRPFFVHFYLFKKTLNKSERRVLNQRFGFYQKLNHIQKKRFEHRVARFLSKKEFIGREGFIITAESKVLIAATATMLTFGFRNYNIDLVETIIVYPAAFYSHSNETYHKGELNPKLRALVLSWEDFVHGYDIARDNLNLGIHEFTHAIHINSLQSTDVSALVFKKSFEELTDLLTAEQALRQKLIASRYFRPYAFTNHYEFLAVIVETFIETPDDFKQQFPRIYKKTKEMLNFNFADY
ncbi:zinc-dependent peptidase [Psychroserpens sp. BH13MA-6]